MTKSIEELLEIVEKGPDSGVSNNFMGDTSNLPVFISDYEIKPGKTRYPTHLIYYYYKKIWRPLSRVKIKKVEFFRRFSKVYVQIRTNKQRYYLLSSKMEFEAGIIKKAKNYDKAAKNGRKSQEKNSKINVSVSGA